MTAEDFTQQWFAATAENFRVLLESAPDAILGVDERGKIVLANSQVEKLFGYAPQELLGQPIEILVPERFHCEHAVDRAKYTQHPRLRPMGKGMQLAARRKDGSEFPAEISLSPMQTERGTVVSCIVRDISDRIHAEEQRVELAREQSRRAEAELARKRYHDLVQELEAVVWEFDLVEQRFTFVTNRAVELLGYPLEKWYRNPRFLVDCAHPDDSERVAIFLRNVPRNGPPEFEFRVVGDDGHVQWVRTIVQVAHDNSGKPVQLRGLMLDTTSRRMAEQALRNSEKLAATGRLAASIAHEINNPMAAVTNVLYLLANHPTLDETAREYTKLAQEELQRVANITRQMLRFYRDSNARAPVNIPELLDSTIALFSRKVQDKRVYIVRRYDDSPGIFGYPGELRQVFSNLLINAVDAVPLGGTITVHVTRGLQWSNGAREGVRILFCDNGSGISSEHIAHIFEPFFTTKEQHGTGLGLWVSHGIVQKHQGEIRVRSSVRPGRSGTCFSIFLPVEAEGEFQAHGAAD